VARGLVALGLLRLDQARYDDAEALVREGLDLSRRGIGTAASGVVEATAALARVYEEKGDYDEAIPLFEEVVRRRALPGDSVTAELATAISMLASGHFYAGHYDAADSLNQIALSMTRRLYGDRHPLVAEDLVNLGATRHQRGRYAEAEAYYRQALDITEAWYGGEHPRAAAQLTMLGRSIAFQRERMDEADELHRRALAIRERVYGPVHPQVASTLNELHTLAYLADRYDDAERYAERVLDIYRAAYPPGHQFIGVALSNLASVDVARGRYVRAEERYREAIAVFSSGLAADHVQIGIGRIKLGRALLRQRRFADAARESGAGYEILVKQTDPAISFLRAARIDLAAAYDTLGQPDRAARFKAELDSVARATAANRD
jgi:serine/threonine-protein kinase